MWKHYLDRLFPVKIDRKPDVLVIEDRRPSDSLLLSMVIFAMSLLFTLMLFRTLYQTGTYWLLILFMLPIPIFGARILMSPFREKYVFNKGNSLYSFTTQSILKRHTLEGGLNEIRAVQMERRTVAGENETREVFQIVFLLRQGLLLSAADCMSLREKSPVNSYYENEARIAYAIADFLKLPAPEVINM
jgi:hypothetical protein